jgi:hypothetical protein
MTERDFEEFDFTSSKPISLTLWLLYEELDHHTNLMAKAVAQGNVQTALFWGTACFHLERFIDANW